MRSMQQSMADNSFSPPFATAKPSFWSELLAPGAFGGFLLIVFVGLEPFALRDNVQAALMTSGEGDLARQVIYITAFLIVVGTALSYRGQKVFLAFPILLVIVLLWCLLSISWAIDPGIATRRLMLTIIIISCVMCSVDMLGTQRSLQVLRFVLATILIVNCVSILVLPQAVHLPGEFEGELAGNWRGLHYHKNIAGPVAALTALLFYHHALATRRWYNWLLFIAAVVFLYGTQSKTAIGFFGASIVFATAYRLLARTDMGRHLFICLIVGVLLLAAMETVAEYETIVDMMDDPRAFTGRVAIWQTMFAYLRENWIFGAGFGSFWQIGDASPALSVASEKWVQIVPHSHSGYLEMLVTTGIFGLILSIIAFFIIPTMQLLRRSDGDIGLKSLLLSVVLFVVLTNLLETIFLNRDRPEWVIYLIFFAILHQMFSKRARTATPSPIRKQPWRNTLPSSQS